MFCLQSIQAKYEKDKIQRASYEIVNLPSLLYNCSTGLGMGKKQEEVLAECQFFFLRLVPGAGPGQQTWGPGAQYYGFGNRKYCWSTTYGAWRKHH